MRPAPRLPAAVTALLVLTVLAGAVALPTAAVGTTGDRVVADATGAQPTTTGSDTETEGDSDDDDDDEESETDGDTEASDDETDATDAAGGDGGSPLWPWAALGAALLGGGLLARWLAETAGGAGSGGGGSGAGGAAGGSGAGGSAGSGAGGSGAGGATGGIGSELLGSVQSAIEGAGSGIEAARAGLVDRWWGLLGTLGYAKWAGDEPLDHDTRGTLYDRVQSDPGVYLSAVAEDDRLDVGFGTVRYHLKILEREGLIDSEKVDGKRRYYPIGADPDALALAMDADTPAAILAALREEPMTVSALSETVDRAPSTVSHHLDGLAEDGLIVRERDGEAVLNELAPGVAAAMGGVDADVEGAPGEDIAQS